MPSPNPISPENWLEISFASLHEVGVAPGSIVTGVGALGDFNQVERGVCTRLKVVAGIAIHADGNPLRNEPTIASSPIAEELRPTPRQGTVRNGRAIIMPSSDPTHLDVVFMGDLRTRGRTVGRLLREVGYSLKTTDLYNQNALQYGFISRTLGSKAIIEETAENMQDLTDASIDEAYRVVRFALRHLYSGGLPGLGR